MKHWNDRLAVQIVIATAERVLATQLSNRHAAGKLSKPLKQHVSKVEIEMIRAR